MVRFSVTSTCARRRRAPGRSLLPVAAPVVRLGPRPDGHGACVFAGVYQQDGAGRMPLALPILPILPPERAALARHRFVGRVGQSLPPRTCRAEQAHLRRPRGACSWRSTSPGRPVGNADLVNAELGIIGRRACAPGARPRLASGQCPTPSSRRFRAAPAPRCSGRRRPA